MYSFSKLTKKKKKNQEKFEEASKAYIFKQTDKCVISVGV